MPQIFKSPKWIILVVLFCLAGSVVKGQNGRPFVSNYPPSTYASNEYTSSPQNWAVIQDVSGKIIVANTSGVLVFDGEEWKMIPGTEGKRFYKLAKDKSGLVFTGGDEDLGFFKPNEKGELQYQTLIEQMDSNERDFGRITNVVSYKGDIFFRSKTSVIRYADGDFTTWYPENMFIKLVSSSAGLFVCEPSKYFRFDDTEFVEIADSEEDNLPNWTGVFLSSSDSLLIATGNDGLFYLYKSKLIEIPNNLGKLTIKNGCEISADRIALATDEYGVIIINNKGRIIEIINESMGLTGNAANFPFYKNGSLWLATNTGVSVVSYPINSSILDKENGVKALPLLSRRFNDQIFVGTYESGYWIKEDALTQLGKLVKVESEISQIFGAIVLDNRLVVANKNGLSVFNSDFSESVISSIKVSTAVIPSLMDKNNVFVSSEYQLSIISIGHDSKNAIISSAQTPHLIYSMAEDNQNRLWAAFNGISYVELNNANEFGEMVTLDSTNGLTEEMGIIEVRKVDGKVLVGTAVGVYSFDDASQKLVPNPIFGEDFSDGSHYAYNVTEMRNGDVWITTNGSTGILRKQNDDSYVYDSLPLIRSGLSDVWNVFEDEDNTVWITGTEGLVKYDPSIPIDYKTPFQSFIRSVVVNETNVIFGGNYSTSAGLHTNLQPESYIPTFKFSEDNLRFKYGAADYATDYKLEYSVKLEGRDQDWSIWQKSSEINYTNLSEGDYTFKVRAKNIYNNISEESSYSFVINPPWYRTIWAYLLFLILAAAIITVIVRFNTIRLRREKKFLEQTVRDRTVEIRKQKEIVEEQKIEVEQQKDEIEKEKHKSDELLLNILPEEVAEELKEKGSADAQLIDEVTVIFTDFKGFTAMSEQLSPKDLIKDLNECFSEFDHIVGKYGIEKIKTIGDAYMAAGGLPTPNTTHAHDVVEAAFEMRDFVERGKAKKIKKGLPYFEVRIGIHSGPVVAGIVGVKKFQYDIWGDTVNTASRMESSGAVGKVNVSQSTHDLLKDDTEFNFQSRGKVVAKGKGEMEMYFVSRR